ncbi:MAG: glycosyltransferase family 1 protein, partial [Planctomycetes bacterium]|nr:glycosyltransferase family 1 protein [Planctomycetota bacterium]
MIEGRIIVCLASAWDYDPTSKHQIMKVLAGRNDIVWINYHGTRRPSMTGADLKTGFSVLRRVLKGIRRVDRSIIQVTPLVVPGARNRFLKRLHQRILIWQIRRAIATIPGATAKPIQVWSFAP